MTVWEAMVESTEVLLSIITAIPVISSALSNKDNVMLS